MNEILYKLTADGYNFLWEHAKNNPDQYLDPSADFGTSLSEQYGDGSYREDSGVRISESLSIPPVEDEARHKGDMRCLDFYRSLEGMTPRIAADPMVLAYINHFHLHAYAVSRWVFKQDQKDKIRSIGNHWFSSRPQYIPKWNTAGRLWWMAHMAIRVARFSEGALTEHEIIEKFVQGAEYYHRSLEYEVLTNPALLAECILRIIDSPDVGIEQYRNMIQTVNRECGARLLDALGRDDLKKLIDGAVDRDT